MIPDNLKRLWILLFLIIVLLSGCANAPEETSSHISPAYDITPASIGPSGWIWRYYPKNGTTMSLIDFHGVWIDCTPLVIGFDYRAGDIKRFRDLLDLFVNDVLIPDDLMKAVEYLGVGDYYSFNISWDFPIEEPGLYIARLETTLKDGRIDLRRWYFIIE